MEITKLYIDCPFCVDGLQTVGGQSVSCASCLGLGFLAWGAQMLDANIISTYKIMEATDIDEFNALSDANKTAYRQAISCGTVDLTDGTQIRAFLWSVFDAQSTTRANLITLLEE